MTPTFLVLAFIAIIWHLLAGIKKGNWEHPAQYGRTGVVALFFSWHSYSIGIEPGYILLILIAVFGLLGNAFFQGVINLTFGVGSFIDPDEERYFDLLGKSIRKPFAGSWRLLQIALGVVVLIVTFGLLIPFGS